MIDRREIMIDGKLMEVADFEQYIKNPNAYLAGYVAVDAHVPYIYPIIPINVNKTGISIRRNAPFMYARVAEGDDREQYKRENIIDYTKVESYRELIQTQEMVRKLEKDILTTPDNIFIPPRDSQDSVAMTAMKDAVERKKIDLEKYEPRFGANFNNDKRTFNKTNISLAKIIRISNALDIKASLLLEDKDPNVPNPMGEPIVVELTSSNSTDDEEV